MQNLPFKFVAAGIAILLMAGCSREGENGEGTSPDVTDPTIFAPDNSESPIVYSEGGNTAGGYAIYGNEPVGSHLRIFNGAITVPESVLIVEAALISELDIGSGTDLGGSEVFLSPTDYVPGGLGVDRWPLAYPRSDFEIHSAVGLRLEPNNTYIVAADIPIMEPDLRMAVTAVMLTTNDGTVVRIPFATGFCSRSVASPLTKEDCTVSQEDGQKIHEVAQDGFTGTEESD